MTRTPQTIEINSRLQIVRLNGKIFTDGLSHVEPRGYAFYCEGLGYLSFASDHKLGDVKCPYTPRGGEKALQEILDQGGFLNFDDIEWLQAV